MLSAVCWRDSPARGRSWPWRQRHTSAGQWTWRCCPTHASPCPCCARTAPSAAWAPCCWLPCIATHRSLFAYPVRRDWWLPEVANDLQAKGALAGQWGVAHHDTIACQRCFAVVALSSSLMLGGAVLCIMIYPQINTGAQVASIPCLSAAILVSISLPSSPSHLSTGPSFRSVLGPWKVLPQDKDLGKVRCWTCSARVADA